jgi:hypothetical protein
MSATSAAPAAPAPQASAVPTSPGDPTPPAAPVPAPYVTIKGRPYTQAELEAALETEQTLGSKITELDSKNAALDRFRDKSKLADVLREFGHDPDEFATERLLQLKAQDEMDPKDRELAEYKARVEAYERERAEQARLAEEAAQKETQGRLRKLAEQRVLEAANKHGLPKSEKALDETLKLIEKAAVRGLDLSEEDAVRLVKEDMARDLVEHFKSFNPEGILALLPKETQKALLKVLTDQALAPSAKAPDTRPGKPAAERGPGLPDAFKKMFDF